MFDSFFAGIAFGVFGVLLGGVLLYRLIVGRML